MVLYCIIHDISNMWIPYALVCIGMHPCEFVCICMYPCASVMQAYAQCASICCFEHPYSNTWHMCGKNNGKAEEQSTNTFWYKRFAKKHDNMQIQMNIWLKSNSKPICLKQHISYTKYNITTSYLVLDIQCMVLAIFETCCYILNRVFE